MSLAIEAPATVRRDLRSLFRIGNLTDNYHPGNSDVSPVPSLGTPGGLGILGAQPGTPLISPGSR